MQANAHLPSVTDPVVIEQPGEDCYYLYWVELPDKGSVFGPFATLPEMAAAKALVPDSSGWKALSLRNPKVPAKELREKQQACRRARAWLLNSLRAV